MVKGGDNYSLGDLGGRLPRSREVICDVLLNRSNGSSLGAWDQRFEGGGVGGQERRYNKIRYGETCMNNRHKSTFETN